MKWTEKQLKQLRIMCLEGLENKGMAAQFGCPLNEIHAKRSQLGLTKDKCLVILKQEKRK